MNFIFFHTITHNEKLLFAWMKQNYPQFNLSFSGLGWVTFKAPENLSLIPILKKMNCPLALRWGIGLDIIKLKEPNFEPLITKIQSLQKAHAFTDIHYFERAEIKPDQEIALSALGHINLPLNQELQLNQNSLQIFKIQDGLYATGLTYCTSWQNPFPGAVCTQVIPSHAPSRAYLKLAQLDDCYQFEWEKKDIVLELGASPGGISTYLLDQDLIVHAVDSAPLKITHPNLKTIINSVQRIHSDDVSPNTKWIVSDLNLSPNQMIQEVLRLSQNLKSLKGMMLTIKLPKIEMVNKLEYYVGLIQKQFPDFHYELQQVPSHRQETHLIALKK